MDVNEEFVSTLINMGFPNEFEIRRALRIGKNDMNEAITILTSGSPISYEGFEDLDVDMKETQHSQYSSPPPNYDEVVESPAEGKEASQNNGDQQVEENPLEFPCPNLIELENRVFTESWSIPYKKDESLGKCLVAATRLAEEGLCESDQNCVRFMNKCLPECFQKLLTAAAVHRWGPEIQEGVYDMFELMIDFMATRMSYEPIPVELLEIVALTFNPDTEYHTKNRTRRPDKNLWEDKLGAGKLFATSPPLGSYREPYGWLTNLINRFAYRKGFEYIQERLKNANLDAPSFAALIAPFGNCSQYLNADVAKPVLEPGLKRAVSYVQGLKSDDLKHKKVVCVCALLISIKQLSLNMWPDDDQKLDNLRLSFILRMLKSPHFNARMNALKEIIKLIEESSGTKIPRTAIYQDKILDWMVENSVLSVALEGNIDQTQYCDKIKNIVDFLGHSWSVEELTKIWKMQQGQSNVVIDNIHSIIAAAAVKFGTQMLEHLFKLVQKSWGTENYKMREKLLYLVGTIGKDTRIQKTTVKVLDLLWDLAHLPKLSTNLMEQALDEHLSILSDSYTVREDIKKKYVNKCVDDIKEGKWVLPALKQLLQITKNIAKHSFHKAEKPILQELNKTFGIIKQVVSSLTKFHQLSVQVCKEGGKDVKLTPDTIIDGRYTHKEYITVHLQFLHFILQEGVLYLHWKRASDLWSTLVSNHDACDWDRETCFAWFTKGISDLEQETQSQLFQKEFLKLDPNKITAKGFTCYKTYFENVNVYEHRLKKNGTVFFVEKSDLVGLDFLWEICLNTQDIELSQRSIGLLIDMAYVNLAYRLKKEPEVLHKKFINECYNRLQVAMNPGGRALHKLLSDASRILASVGVPEFGTVPCPARTSNLLNIERLLLIAEKYIVTVEESHNAARTILPHGASFQGTPISLFVTCENPKTDFTIRAHSNQTVGAIKLKIATKLKFSAEGLQLMVHDKSLTKDQKLLHQLDIDDKTMISARSYGSSISSSSTDITTSILTSKQSFEQEQEKLLPGVIMASGGQVFGMLYQLANFEEPKITSRVRSLLKLIPTDASVQDSLDGLGVKQITRQATPEPPSPRASPRPSSPRKLAQVSPAPTPPTTPTLSPKEMLKNLFNANAEGMATFRVLYNLEVLSSKLMPTTHDITILQSAHSFCEHFLNVGGLQLVVDVLHRDSIPPDVDYETRQGCYVIALQLLRFLLCGQEVTGETVQMSGRRSSTSSLGAGAMVTGSTTGSTSSGPPSIELTPSTACKAVQTMGVKEFTETVACFMRVAWASAAGKLNLASSSQPIKDSGSVMNSSIYSSGSSKSRQSSTGSTNSSGSESEALCLHPGVCIKQNKVSAKDTNIAQESLELLVTCLQLRSSLLASFYSLPFVSEFIIDILVGSPNYEIRDVARDQFFILSQTEVTPGENLAHQQTPHYFILHTLLKARLPFWVSSSSTRGSSYRLLKQCSQYFDLRCKLMDNLNDEEQQRFGLKIDPMIQDEIDWLHNFVPSDNDAIVETDNLLIAGHLRLISTLVTCQNVNKRKYGRQLIKDLLHDFLFPSSLSIMDDNLSKDSANNSTIPKCSDSKSRVAAYELMVVLADGCLENLQELCNEVVTMHHESNPEINQQWEYMPPVDGRSKAGFVGLKNGGATCYMNSVLQQLYMTPGVKETILGTDEEGSDEESVFYQLQQIFGHMLDSKLQYYVPEKFWKVFQLWGQSVNIREQQDALDFYQAIIDQVDEHLKQLGKDSVFKKTFQGVYSDQKICKDCPHRYEREEIFYALNVTVKNTSLQDSLSQFVKGELLEGDNAYFCEKCGEKRNTVKRMCIKTLPPVLCIQLKRFGYDWEANRALKFDDYFTFPWVLDMEPYTSEGMSRRDEQVQLQSLDSSSSSLNEEAEDEMKGMGPGGVETLTISCVPNTPSKQINYCLVGVVVHSGQANAGHYYSFIKDRRGNYMNNPTKGKWYKFNDMEVQEFDMNDGTLEEECFGGTYKAKVYEQSSSSSSYPEERLRYWNGYLLLYERMDCIRTPVSAKKSKMTIRKSLSEKRPSYRRNSDSLVELTELVHKGDKKGIFQDKMPAHIQRVVREENLKFMKNRDVYCLDYFRFIMQLASKNTSHEGNENYADLSLESLKLAVNFLFNTFFRTKKKLRNEMTDWVIVVENILQLSKSASVWLVEYLSSPIGRSYLKPFLLECPGKEIRVAFSQIVESTIKYFFHHGGMPLQKCFDEFLETLLHMLNKDVPDNCKHCTQYFYVIYRYSEMDTKSCSHMFGRRAFQRLAFFLLGDSQVSQNNDHDNSTRRWSSLQSRDFGPLHETMATLVLNCDVSQNRTEDTDKFAVRKPTTVTPQVLLKMSAEMNKFVFGTEAHRYLREVVLALREVPSQLTRVEDMLLYCSFCNGTFTMTVIKNIMIQYTTAPSNELKGLLSALLKLLLLEDPMQLKRLQCVIDGYVDEHNVEYEGMLAVIKSKHMNDSRRSYQCIKFLVNLSHRCSMAKDYLMQSSTKWSWAVNWLKKKMSENYWTPTVTTLSNESSDSRTFQRTVSAQDTLEDATALLTDFEAQYSDMETNGGGGNGDEASSPTTDTSETSNTVPDTPELDKSTDINKDMGLDEIDNRL